MAWNRPVNHSVHAPVRALVLAGGGARGSYQVGVWRALTELGWRPGIITGTSVGSLNGAMFALDLYETARDMWLTIRSQDVMELPEENADLSALHSFLRSVVKAGGMDVTPLEEIVERVLDEDALRASPIRLGLVTVEQRGLKARELALDDIPHGKVKDYLLASAACFPALRAHIIDGVSYLDGGYRDNMPTALAQKMGADELVCVDLEGVGVTRPNRTGLPTTLIRSYWELGDILHFDPDTARRNMELGYYDTRRAMGYLRGCAYAVSCDARSCQDAAAFAWQFGQQQKSVREKYPVNLTSWPRWKPPPRMWAWTPHSSIPRRHWARRFWKNAKKTALRALPRCLRAAAARRMPPGPRYCPTRSYRHWCIVC